MRYSGWWGNFLRFIDSSRPLRVSAFPAHIRQWADVAMSLYVAIVCRLKACWLSAQGTALGKRYELRRPRYVAQGSALWKRHEHRRPREIGMHSTTESRQGFHICSCGRYPIVGRGAGVVCAEAVNAPPRKGITPALYPINYIRVLALTY